MGLIKLVVGDFHNYNKTESFSYESSLNQSNVEKAYVKGTELVGFDITKRVTFTKKDLILPKQHLSKLKAHGFNTKQLSLACYKVTEKDVAKDLENTYPERDWPKLQAGIRIFPEDFAKIYLFIASIGNPAAVFKKVTSENIYIGGSVFFD